MDSVRIEVVSFSYGEVAVVRGVSLAVGPDAGNLPVRFDSGRWKRGRVGMS